MGKSADEKVLVVRTPNSLMGRLAELRKGLPRPQAEPAEKSEEERTVVRRSLREKYKEEEKITEKIIGTAMESVFFEEAAAEELINKLLEEEDDDEGEERLETMVDDHDKLDF